MRPKPILIGAPIDSGQKRGVRLVGSEMCIRDRARSAKAA